MNNNRTERLVMLCNVEDAARIKAAADEARLTVSTFMLRAVLDQPFFNELLRAVGMFAAIKPDMEMDITHPVKMAQEVYAYVMQLREGNHA